jgi:protease-4
MLVEKLNILTPTIKGEPAMNLRSMFISLLAVCSMQGCAFISIPLSSRTLPLEEKVLEGEGRDKILLIDISGIITSEKKRSFADLDSGPDMVARVKEELTQAAEDDRIKAIILKINSPGGTVTASDIIYKEILKFKEKNKIYVTASLMDIAASGGYYIACAADTIVAHPTAVTGSIGVIAMKFNVKGLMDKLGVQDDTIKAGDMKDSLSPFRPMTDEERQIIQDIIDSLHQQFMEAVVQGRKDLSLDEVKPLADGRVFTARQALEAELIDDIGYLDDAIDITKKETDLKEARIITYYRPSSYKNNIYSQTSFSIFNFGDNDFLAYLPVRFMYLWNP